MSIKIMSALWEMSFSPTEKLVFLALADCANDEGVAWPSISTIARKTGVGERTVQRAIREGEKSGLIARQEVIGKGCRYTINPRHSDTPATKSPVTNETKTPATVTPHPRHSDTQTIKEPLEPPISCASGDAPALKPEHIVEHWNELATKLGKPRVRDLTPERRQLLKARIGQYSLDDFVNVFGKIDRSPFLRGETGWRGMTFDWIFKKANFQKTLEGNYDN